MSTGMRLFIIYILLVLTACTSGPHYDGPKSDHFNGQYFYNREPTKHGGFLTFLKWRFNRNAGLWQEWTDVPFGPPPLRKVARGKLRITIVNHATTLVQMDGLNILTDPIWSERASPFSWIGPKRARPPGIKFDDLPKIDIVVISHNHYDHLDLPTLVMLYNKHKPLFFVGLGNAKLLRDEGIQNVREIDWWQTVSVNPDFQVTAVPSRHFSSRGFTDRKATLWLGYVLTGSNGAVYFAGDTGYGQHFKHIANRFRNIRLALLPIGAYLPGWFMSSVHLSPQEAVNAHADLKAKTSVAVHYGTFELGDDGQYQAETELKEILITATETREKFWVLKFGEGRDVP